MNNFEFSEGAVTGVLARLAWPKSPSIAGLAAAVGDAVGLKVSLRPIPPEFRHAQVSGLTYASGATAQVFYDENLSPLVGEQTIMHEFAHLLHGDIRPDQDPIHYRSMFDDPIEHRAELTGTRLWQELQRRATSGDSEVAGFMTGKRVWP